jgi:hypothetical protein
MDLACPSGIPAKYGCSNMGITAGCGDIYSRGLDCQWIDITDVPTGDYILAAKVNWDQSPDALGRIEMNYMNNWVQVCLRIYTDSNGLKQYSKYPNCNPYVDCQGVTYGNAVRDCRGICAGTAVRGDMNQDSIRNSVDVPYYLTGLVQQLLPYSECADLSGDSTLNVWDAALLGNCLMNNNTGQACSFPRGLQSVQTHTTKILAVDTVQRFVDIAIRNPQHRLTALDFEIHGIRPLQVTSLSAPGSPLWQFTFANNSPRIVAMAQNLTQSLARDSLFQPMLRIFYSRTNDTAIYLQRTHAGVNEYFENLVTLTDSTRWRVALDRSSVENLNQRPALRLYPNPTKGSLTLEFPASDQSAHYRVLGSNGKVYLQSELSQPHQGRQDLDFTETLPPGLYLLEYRGPLGRNLIRFVKH